MSARSRLIVLLGPAFVAAVAYVDPGNVAANLTAGADYGYGLLWVLVLANLMAVLVQYLSAKVGITSGRSLPQLVGERLGRRSRLTYWAQAELVAAATDLAEVVGGAIALHILFDLPLLVGGLITAVVSLGILALQTRHRSRTFEIVILGLLLIITGGFLAGLVIAPVSATGIAGGLVPRFADTNAVLIAASMLGATVMPHVIYLHSSLGRDHAERTGATRTSAARTGTGRSGATTRARLLHATRIDVVLSLLLAGSVNIGMLVLAAAALPGADGTDTIDGAHAQIAAQVGPVVGGLFAVGLLASALASTSVGAFAGSEIMAGLLHRRIPLLARRAVTVLPALLILAIGADPTEALVLSQVVLSLGIPFALVPLVRFASDRTLMGEHPTSRWLIVAAWTTAVAIIALNLLLVALWWGPWTSTI
ncbi:Nramp family divalent metal transporter [Helcobacillus sp. ACRRO]|uniref:Nramp family divalent metal transporter n=1 Tax=Helcobacillus sp. ACRRO TaxID=2918202 RepID=UPI001EF44B95|nr:Nramp family divalent metal transporter [Helcobacillus sp. ACRRO]MCG7427702.1 Nramp family divalent metal transporter [Helcobacillus sp. ACRRO]